MYHHKDHCAFHRNQWFNSCIDMHHEHTSYCIGSPIGYERDRLDIQVDMKTELPSFRTFMQMNTNLWKITVIHCTPNLYGILNMVQLSSSFFPKFNKAFCLHFSGRYSTRSSWRDSSDTRRDDCVRGHYVTQGKALP